MQTRWERLRPDFDRAVRRLLSQSPWSEVLQHYLADTGHWPTEDAWLRMTLSEARAALEAKVKAKGGKIIEGFAIEEDKFEAGKPVDLDLSPEAAEALNRGKVPEPLLRRVGPGTTRGSQ